MIAKVSRGSRRGHGRHQRRGDPAAAPARRARLVVTALPHAARDSGGRAKRYRKGRRRSASCAVTDRPIAGAFEATAPALRTAAPRSQERCPGSSGVQPPVGVLALQGDVREHLRVLTSLGAPDRRTAAGRARGVRRAGACRAASRPRWTSSPAPSTCSSRCASGCRGPARLRHLRRDDHAGRPDRRRHARPGDPRRARHHGAPQRLRAPGRLLRGRPRLRRARRHRCTPCSSGRPGSRRSGRASRCSAASTGGPAAGRIVAVRQGALMATSFHPEVGGDDRIHRLFVDLID